MSEEEKKAIEYLRKNPLVRVDEKGKIIASGNAYKIVILNLIEKQNNKIEELKVYDNIEYQKYLYGNIEENYIPKSVIREKIESLKEQLKNAKDEAYDICESKIWALEDLLD